MSAFVSEIDQFLQSFDRRHVVLSASQQKEIAKHQRISRLRDEAIDAEKPKKLWEDF